MIYSTERPKYGQMFPLVNLRGSRVSSGIRGFGSVLRVSHPKGGPLRKVQPTGNTRWPWSLQWSWEGWIVYRSWGTEPGLRKDVRHLESKGDPQVHCTKNGLELMASFHRVAEDNWSKGWGK